MNGAKVMVDIERARTFDNWLPRRLGGTTGGEKRRCHKTEAAVRRIMRELTPEPEKPKRREREREREKERERDRSRDKEKRHHSHRER